MGGFEHLIDGLAVALRPDCLLAAVGGVIVGIIFGAIPGLNATLAIALFLPVTFLMPPDAALILLSALYVAGIYGGSISAVVLGIPGTAASVMTAVEGYGMARQGQANRALQISAFASGLGGLLSAIALVTMTPALARVALSFGPSEFSLLIVFSLLLVILMSPQNLFAGFGATALGLMFAMVGYDPVAVGERLTFGIAELRGGLPLVPVLLAFFAAPQVIRLAVDALHGTRTAVETTDHLSFFGTAAATFRHKWSVLRASTLGLGIGILPAVGVETSPILAHTMEKRFSKDPKFGGGSEHGLIAAESANNATVGGSLIPLIGLGIPGSAPAAVMLGALTMHNVAPGPLIFITNGEVIYALFAGFIVINVLMMIVGVLLARQFALTLKLPKGLIATFVTAAAIFGSYASGTSLTSVFVLLGGTGVVTVMLLAGIPILPCALAFVLGRTLENQLAVSFASMSGIGDLLSRPASVVLIILTLVAVVILMRMRRAEQANSTSANLEEPVS
ncbi:tripartite tricarboxylate transporter permease [Pseudooceanicola onchidii]|uniref:tripartite tricarboxylate transporter permease n=1 Tax=Pseudooceanicola onchidii TaxID=2562279 RepID=UPI0010AA0DE9|nr:tripartite tricarboxylate transporter permease [Pseudooceanicola onchidii]